MLAFVVTGCSLIKSEQQPLSLALYVSSEVQSGETVRLELRVSKRGVQPLELRLRGRPAYDFVVNTNDGVEVWRWSHGKVIQNTLLVRTLTLGDSLVFTAEWDQRDSEGRLVHPGIYWVRGFLNLDSPKQVDAKPERLIIRPGPPLALRLEVPATMHRDGPMLYWKLGQKLPLKLKLKNRSDQLVQVNLSSHPAFDFVVTKDKAEIWRWSYGKSILETAELKTLNPGEELEFEADWDQRDNKGNLILPGSYEVRGILNVAPHWKLETEPLFVAMGPGLPLQLTLEVPKEALASESVPLKLKIENTSGKVLNLEVGYAPHDFIVTTPDGAEVWRWSYGKAFPLVTRPLILQPNEVKEFSETWDQLDKEGYPVLAGTYNVYGIFRASQLEGLFETEQSKPQKLIITP
jgi:hypothetical protein